VFSVSAAASRPAAQRRPPLGLDTLLRPPTSTLFIPGPLAVLTQAYFKEHQEQGCAEPSRHQGDGEHLARQSADQDGAYRTGHNEHGDRPKRQDARARGHGPKVPPRGTPATRIPYEATITLSSDAVVAGCEISRGSVLIPSEKRDWSRAH
jgi:hypothetical protein